MGTTEDFLELIDSNAALAPAGRGRFRFKGGVLQQSVDGGAWTTIGGGGGGGTVTSVSGTAPIQVATGTTTPAITIDAATTSTPGSLAALDKVAINDFSGSWAEQQWRGSNGSNGILSLIPQLTQYRYMPTSGYILQGTSPFSTAFISGSIEGGSIAVSSTLPLTQGITQAVKTLKWAIAFRAKFAAPTSGKTATVGLVNVGTAARTIDAGTVFATSTTKWVIRCVGGTSGAGTLAADTSVHNFWLFSDGTTIKLYVDGVDSGASVATSTLAADEPMCIWGNNTTQADTNLSDLLWAWV